MEAKELVPSFETCNKFLENNIKFDESVFIWVRFPDSEEPQLILRNDLLDNNQYEYLCGGPTEGEITDALILHGYYGASAMYSADVHEGATHDHDWAVLALAPKDNWLVTPQHSYNAVRIEAYGRVLLKVIENEEEKKVNSNG